MFDIVKLHLKAGNGGNGKVSFRREKFIQKGGPDGGNAGSGGSIYIVGDRHVNTLQHYAGAKSFAAGRGEDGGSQRSIGHKGSDLELKVPIGTTVWILAENRTSRIRRQFQPYENHLSPRVWLKKYYLDRPSGNPPARPDQPVLPVELDVVSPLEGIEQQEDDAVLTPEQEERTHLLRSASLKNVNIAALTKVKRVEITEEGQRFLLAKGGAGGRGNEAFKSSQKTTPQEAEYGSFGEEQIVLLELRLLADVGLIGYPNAGKSTLLSMVTKANPKIADYPFTTLEPQLGVLSVSGVDAGMRDIILADLPGIIEGAHTGKGLGYDFLRHVQTCRMLLIMVTLPEGAIYDTQATPEELAQQLWQQYDTLLQEMRAFDPSLLDKPRVVALSKQDLFTPEQVDAAKKRFAEEHISLFHFSAATHTGLDELTRIFVDQTSSNDTPVV